MSRHIRTLLAACALALGLTGAYLVVSDVPVRTDGSAAVQSQTGDAAAVQSQTETAHRERVRVESSRLSAFHYQGLSEDERATYDALYAGATQQGTTFDITIPNSDDIEVALHALVCDHPELFWLSGACTYQDLMFGDVSVELGRTVDEDDVEDVQAAIDEEVDAFLAALSKDASTYDVVRAAYEWVINNTDYGYSSAQNQNIQSVFIDHESVCAGYAKAFQYLLGRADVPCAYVRGTIAADGVEHAWNIVEIDGAYTYVDVTWGDPTYTGSGGETYTGNITYDFLCLTTEEMERSGHVLADGASLPACDSDEYDYYRRSGLLFDTYDKALTDAVFVAAFDAGDTGVAFKFTNDEAYQAALDALESHEMLRGAFVERASALQGAGESVRYQLTYTDELRVIKVFW